MDDLSFDFSGRTAIVTGASSGIGREVGRAFGAAGAMVINADLQPDPRGGGNEPPTHELIRDEGGQATYVETDVSDVDDITAVVEAAREYGGVDVMVNNAGTHRPGSVQDVTVDQYEFVSSVNTKGVLFGCRAAANEMIEQDEGGSIVNTASIRYNTPFPDQILYNASKGAVGMITRSAALELAASGVRVNAIAPGRTVTALSDGTTDAEERVDEESLIKPIPMGRPAYPDDIAPAVLFLCSDAASYLTGEILVVDGGWSIY